MEMTLDRVAPLTQTETEKIRLEHFLAAGYSLRRVGLIENRPDLSHPGILCRKIYPRDFSRRTGISAHATGSLGLLSGCRSEEAAWEMPVPDLAIYLAVCDVKRDIARRLPVILEWFQANRVGIVVFPWGQRSMAAPALKVLSRWHDAGGLFLAAAGNGPLMQPLSPARHAKVICVGALGQDGRPLMNTYCGDKVDLWAPGEGIFTLWPRGKIRCVSGTSASCVLAAGRLLCLVNGRKQGWNMGYHRLKYAASRSPPSSPEHL